jgi:DNA-binding beta-propeller fold protein YncE
MDRWCLSLIPPAGSPALGVPPRGRRCWTRDGGTGGLTFVGTVSTVTGSGQDNPHAMVVSPDGKNVYVTVLDDVLLVFSRDAALGTLTLLESHQDGVAGLDGLDEPRGLGMSPDGQNVYVAATTDDAVVVFDRDGTTGALTFREAHFDGSGGVTGPQRADAVAVSPDGDMAYVGTSQLPAALAIFDRDPSSGALSFVDVHHQVSPSGGYLPSQTLVVGPDGRSLYGTPAVHMYRRTLGSGALELRAVDTTANIPSAGIAVSPTVVTSMRSSSRPSMRCASTTIVRLESARSPQRSDVAARPHRSPPGSC